MGREGKKDGIKREKGGRTGGEERRERNKQ